MVVEKKNSKRVNLKLKLSSQSNPNVTTQQSILREAVVITRQLV